MLGRAVRVILVFGCILSVPSIARAQGAIGGQVRDTSGAVLPGVSVEAASDSLIEKVRTAVTDNRGQYLIVDLRPGIYTVTFTLPGFSTFKRDGLELTAGVTLPINADLTVGTLEETVTVSGDTPVVDVQNTRQQIVINRELLDVIPRSRNMQHTTTLLPGVTSIARDMGGSTGEPGITVSIHGGIGGDGQYQVDGMRTTDFSIGGGNNVHAYADAGVQEYVIETSAISAETAGGGIRMNIIPKEGGNRFTPSIFGNFTNESMNSQALSDSLKERGVTNAEGVIWVWDFNPALGGPIVRDRVWFFGTYRNWGKDKYVANNYFDTDPTRPASDPERFWSVSARVTWQINAKNKLTVYGDDEGRWSLYRGNSTTLSPEASVNWKWPEIWMTQAKWTSPLTTRVLVELGFIKSLPISEQAIQPLTPPGAYSTFEITQGRTTLTAPTFDINHAHQAMGIGSMSYITGSHAFKVGFSLMRGSRFSRINSGFGHDLQLRLNNGQPFQVTLYSTPNTHYPRFNHDFGLYAQDQWKLNRFTINAGIRFDSLNVSIDEQDMPAGRWVPARHFDEIRDVPNWKDINPRFGVVYDLFGTGKTALKTSMSRYVRQDFTSLALQSNPARAGAGASDTRTWTDRNNDRIPTPDEFGPTTNVSFGLPVFTVRPADEIRKGWGVRPVDWEYVASVNHELKSGLSASVSYHRRWFGNLTWTDNTLVELSDYTTSTFVSPYDGEVITLYNLLPSKRGLVNNVISHAPENSQVFDGVDVLVNGRFGAGTAVSGGVAIGRTRQNTCTTDNPNALRFCDVQPPFFGENQYKFVVAHQLPRGFQISSAFQSVPGPRVAANYAVTSAIAGVPLTLGTVTVNLVEPGSFYGDRLNQFDLRLTKTFQVRRARVQPIAELFNVFSATPIYSENSTWGPSWRLPGAGNRGAVMPGRMFKVGAQVDF